MGGKGTEHKKHKRHKREKEILCLLCFLCSVPFPKNFPRQIIIIKVYSVRNSPQGERL